MLAATYEKTSLPWSWQQTERQWSEQVEAWLTSSQTPDLAGLETPGQILAIVLAVLFALGLLGLLGRWLMRLLAVAPVRLSRTAPTVPTAPTDSTAWWVRAQDLRQTGDYRGACLALYRALLQLLAEREIAAQQASRTDGEYRRLLAAHPRAEAARELIGVHERLAFGNGEATAETFERCCRAYEQWR